MQTNNLMLTRTTIAIFIIFGSIGLFGQAHIIGGCGTDQTPIGFSNNNSDAKSTNCSTPTGTDLNTFEQDHLADLVPTNSTRKIRIRTNVILLQNASGEGNFELSNQVHQDFLDDLYDMINNRISNMQSTCTSDPSTLGDLNIEYVPNFIEIQDEFLWNHRNDPQHTVYDSGESGNKSYLNDIQNLVFQDPAYEQGFDVIITTDASYHYGWDRSTEIWRTQLWSDLGGWYFNGFFYSGFPTLNLSYPARWHAPDFFLLYENFKAEKTDPEWFGSRRQEVLEYFSGLFIHEYGHYFNLGHFSSTCSTDFMNQGGFETSRAYTHFSDNQSREAYKTFMFKNLRSSIICEDKIDHDLIISSNETWDYDIKVYGDIIVEDGATLDIDCKLTMQSDGKIFVKRGGTLNVNGGTITTDCGMYWHGIRIEGYSDFSNFPQSQAGKIYLNGALIENAQDAISTDNIHIPYPQKEDYYGGLIIAENTTFKNGWRAVELMKYAINGHDDQSYFLNCTFEDLSVGISNWSSNGVEITSCDFVNITKQGILPYNAEVIVTGCNFTNSNIGVDAINTSPTLYNDMKIGGSNIGESNYFNCSSYGIRVVSTVSYGNNYPIIQYNSIDGGIAGILLDGPNKVTIFRNNIDGSSTGVQTMNCGSSTSYIQENAIDNSVYGCQNIGNNDGMNYIANCFRNNSASDIKIESGGTINNPQSLFKFYAADNKFSGQTTMAIDNKGSSTLQYYSRTTNQGSPFYPSNSTNVSVLVGTPTAISDPCAGKSALKSDTDFFEETSHCFDLSKASMNNFEIKKRLDVFYDKEISNELSNTEQQCYKELSTYYAKNLITTDNTDDAVAFLSHHPIMDIRLLTLNVLISKNKYEEAKSFLSTIKGHSRELYTFSWMQELFIDFITNKTSKDRLENDLVSLKEYGLLGKKYSGYARAIFQFITGETIILSGDFSPISIHNNGDNNPENLIKIYPNPFSMGSNDLINMDIPIEFYEEGMRLTIYDLLGHKISTKSVPLYLGNNAININELPSGILLMVVRDKMGKAISTNKILLVE
ncbi:hypothetical protein [Lewinella sp. W8]|uniref:hypothetical protein n=1 Tax=Lewinella sp. W8 TaxID=2528208 RepID=UPI00106874B3|nr:hypothetical protein [Lewinella sp. W8]MTB50541.1 hypothetical protein [Lewinella sp. W8]